MAALTLTALYLGVMVDERQRAHEGLKQSLRLAAAGEMAGAIAHEVNQPLTALTNYGRSAQLLIAAGRASPSSTAVDRAACCGEAQRASEVVRRLRDFFRQGTHPPRAACRSPSCWRGTPQSARRPPIPRIRSR